MPTKGAVTGMHPAVWKTRDTLPVMALLLLVLHMLLCSYAAAAMSPLT